MHVRGIVQENIVSPNVVCIKCAYIITENQLLSFSMHFSLIKYMPITFQDCENIAYF
jgi:hypothetical protein